MLEIRYAENQALLKTGRAKIPVCYIIGMLENGMLKISYAENLCHRTSGRSVVGWSVVGWWARSGGGQVGGMLRTCTSCR